jgi:hypothetical protein
MSGACPRLGYRVIIDIAPGASPAVRDAFAVALTEFLRGRGLSCDSRRGVSLEYVVASEASQATNADRVATEGWLASRDEVREWRMGDLEDLDHTG